MCANSSPILDERPGKIKGLFGELKRNGLECQCPRLQPVVLSLEGQAKPLAFESTCALNTVACQRQRREMQKPGATPQDTVVLDLP